MFGGFIGNSVTLWRKIRNIMRKQFFLFALLLSVSMARAASDGVNAMLLEGPSDKFTILLDDQPVVTFSDEAAVGPV